MPMPDDSLHVPRNESQADRAGAAGEDRGQRAHVAHSHPHRESRDSVMRQDVRRVSADSVGKRTSVVTTHLGPYS